MQWARDRTFGGLWLLGIVGPLMMAGGGCSDGSQPASTGYNVLLITTDTTRADRLGSYGYDKPTSPNLDALARDAIRFEFAISTAGLTPIAHASIFTGLNPYLHGVRVMYGSPGHYLSKSTLGMATLLKQKGYATAGFVSAYPASERYGMHWGFDTFENGMKKGTVDMDPSRQTAKGLIFQHGKWADQPKGDAQRRADSTTADALAWLANVKGSFFQWVHYFDPHDPWLIPPKRYLDKFGVKRGAPDEMLTVYDADINYMDFQIGRLLQAYKDRDLYDKTIIIVISDHGQGLEDHDWFRHRLLYREQIHVPLIVRLPNGPHGKIIPDLVRNIDLLPTVCELLGVKLPDDVEGKSLLGLINGAREPPRLAYAEALNTADAHLPKKLPEDQKDLLFCMMDRDWKLIYHKDRPQNSELYDLKNDPKELVNVFGKHPEQTMRLMQALEKSGGLNVRLTGAAPMDEETRRSLEALGYIDGADGG